MESYTCPICGNSDTRYIGIRNGKQYCRKCITCRMQQTKNSKNITKEKRI